VPNLGVLRWEFGPPESLEKAKAERSGWHPDNLRRPGFKPRTVIDVGAGFGTPEIYKAFPEAHQVLVEPLHEYDEPLELWLNQYRGERIAAAVGDQEGAATMRVDPEAPWTSSFLRYTRRMQEPARAEEREVPMTTLDRLLADRGWESPFFLKIDAEGYELRVLRGAERVLEQSGYVLVEATVARRLEGGYSFAELVAFMDAHGFGLCDVIDGMKAAPGAGASYIDALFRSGSGASG
jgi:FkbM family methyltransferase